MDSLPIPNAGSSCRGISAVMLASFMNLFSPPLIALLAILVLAFPKPSMSAIFLFLQSILININLFFIDGINADFLAVSMLLSFISMIVIGANMFIEISYKNPTRRMAKFNIFIGIVFVAFFWFKIMAISPITIANQNENNIPQNQDSFTLITIAYCIFTILASSFAVLEIKQRKNT